MSSRQGAMLLASGRAALGVAVLLAPEPITSRWLGRQNAELPVVGDLARSLGVRDLALGAAVLTTLDYPAGPRIQAACALADVVDVAATIAARKALPRQGVLGTVVVAGLAAAAGFAFSHRMAHAEQA